MPVAEAPPPTLTVRPWPDEVIDRVGHDPRSLYVERFWLPLLGPSSVLLLRRLAQELEQGRGEVALEVDDVARSLGLATRTGPASSFARTVDRCRHFHLVHLDGTTRVLLARRKVPPLTRGQVARLPEVLRADHDRWLHDELVSDLDGERMKRRARRLALGLLELEDRAEDVERQLHRWRFHPAIAHDAVAWALALRVEPDPPSLPPAA